MKRVTGMMSKSLLKGSIDKNRIAAGASLPKGSGSLSYTPAEIVFPKISREREKQPEITASVRSGSDAAMIGLEELSEELLLTSLRYNRYLETEAVI